MKYILTHAKIDGAIKVEYDEQGRIKMFEFDCDASGELWSFIMGNFPVMVDDLKAPGYKNFTMSEVYDDTSFDAFWKAYNYKVGNKARAEKLWKLLSEIQKMQVLIRIKQYDAYLMTHPAQEKCYPETFLHQKRWENEFR